MLFSLLFLFHLYIVVFEERLLHRICCVLAKKYTITTKYEKLFTSARFSGEN